MLQEQRDERGRVDFLTAAVHAVGPGLALHYGDLLRDLADITQLPLHKELHRRQCCRCSAIMHRCGFRTDRPRYRTRTRPDGVKKVVLYKCSTCGGETVFPVVQPQVPKVKKKKKIVEVITKPVEVSTVQRAGVMNEKIGKIGKEKKKSEKGRASLAASALFVKRK